MQARMTNPAFAIPEAMPAIQALIGSARKTELPPSLFDLVHLRVSQINSCAFCIDLGAREARKAGDDGERLFAISAWRDAPYFSEAERAALALAEEVTRIADRGDAVPDAVWNEAARHFDEKELASLLLWIATTNLFNRLNVAVRQPVGSWTPAG